MGNIVPILQARKLRLREARAETQSNGLLPPKLSYGKVTK